MSTTRGEMRKEAALRSPQIDVSTAADDSTWSFHQKGVLALAALAFGASGLASQALGIAMPALIRAWGIPREAFAWATAAGLFGVALGSIGGGLVGDRIGRRAGV